MKEKQIKFKDWEIWIEKERIHIWKIKEKKNIVNLFLSENNTYIDNTNAIKKMGDWVKMRNEIKNIGIKMELDIKTAYPQEVKPIRSKYIERIIENNRWV